MRFELTLCLTNIKYYLLIYIDEVAAPFKNIGHRSDNIDHVFSNEHHTVFDLLSPCLCSSTIDVSSTLTEVPKKKRMREEE